MKASELRERTIKTQFENIMKTIERRSTDNKYCIIAGIGSLYPEVAEMISKEGYDVKVIHVLNDDMMSYAKISWEHAKEGKEGTVEYVDCDDPEASLIMASIPWRSETIHAALEKFLNFILTGRADDDDCEELFKDILEVYGRNWRRRHDDDKAKDDNGDATKSVDTESKENAAE